MLRSLFLFILSGLILTACSKSDDQRRFEDEAFTEPQGITQTSSSGNIIQDSEDPGDWNISPMYQALITVQPVYPNPVIYNSSLTLHIDQNVSDAVSGIVIWSFRYPGQLNPTPIELDQSNIHQFNTITIPASSIATEGASGIDYRILVYDGRDNLITYGDVRVN